MPDKWEYPWFAAWDLAFYTIPIAMIDPEWARRQLVLLLREWYMHPNGQIPTYEWEFSDVNPPVHAWAAWQVYRITRDSSGRADTAFLERIFHKLLLNFTWWVNRKDIGGNNVFQGGFLSLDNIGIFDRSAPPPIGGYLEQADGTAFPLRLRSFVGLLPIFAAHILESQHMERLPRFRRRVEWFLKYRPLLTANVAPLSEAGPHGHYQLAIVDRAKLARILERVFDAEEFLSEYGLRGLSRVYADHPHECRVGDRVYPVRYEPAESTTGLFGGNSNWRGPVWFPINSLMIEALRKYHHHYGDSFKVEVPRGSGNWLTLGAAADELSRHLMRIFLRDEKHGGRRPVYGDTKLFQTDPHGRDHILFHEYFHGDNGSGLGASHQTGWTALVAKLSQDCGGVTKTPP